MKVQIDVDQLLWRDVKIEAMKRGDLLREFVGKALESACGKQGEALGRVATVKGGATPPPAAKPAVSQSRAIGGVPVGPLVDAISADGTCFLCKKTGVKTALNKDRKWVCYECAGVKS